ncbi:MAG TPA: hypothetical protein PKE55_04435, partial [Kiritimatiellia bacterium]|nr:hypothetical protein [Kiritimatiellia bacterium]
MIQPNDGGFENGPEQSGPFFVECAFLKALSGAGSGTRVRLSCRSITQTKRVVLPALSASRSGEESGIKLPHS